MYEVELKVRADHDAVRERLAGAGATHRGAVTQVDTYYDAPHRDFAESDEALRLRTEEPVRDTAEGGVGDATEGVAGGAVGGAGRGSAGDDGDSAGVEAVEDGVARRGSWDDDGSSEATGPTYRLAYKGPLVEEASKTREEVDVAVTDGDAVDAILRNLGFEPAARVRKERDRYDLDGYRVVLDGVDGLGEFVEVESEASAADLDAVRNGARDVLARLGLDADAGIRTSYLSMLPGDAPE